MAVLTEWPELLSLAAEQGTSATIGIIKPTENGLAVEALMNTRRLRPSTEDINAFCSQLTMAASQGIAEAQYRLGTMYREGVGVVQNYSKAIGWYEKAAKQGFVEAQVNLADMYFNEKYKCFDIDLAKCWFWKAANQGNKDAQFMYACIYANGEDGVPMNPMLTYVWAAIAATTGEELAVGTRDCAADMLTRDELYHAQALSLRIQLRIQKRHSQHVNDNAA